MKFLIDTEGLEEALAILHAGGVVVHATETTYGLACDLGNIEAVKKVFAIKQRPLDMPISSLFASIDQAKEYTQWNEKAEELAKKHLPGPLTLILPLRSERRGTLFPMPQNDCSSVGVRVSSHPTAQKLAEVFGKPLSTTSANIHGQPPLYDPDEIAKQFANQTWQPNLLLSSGILPLRASSTVISLVENAQTVLRKGEVRL